MSRAKELFELFTQQPTGAKLLIPCETLNEVDSLRRSLARFRDNSPAGNSIVITMDSGNKSVTLQKVSNRQPLLISPEGEVSIIVSKDESEQLKRLVSSALADGMQLGEMLELWGERFGESSIQEVFNEFFARENDEEKGESENE